MNCIFLSRGETPPLTKTVTLAGSFNLTYGYVSINGTKYIDAQALEVEVGTEISVHVSGIGSTASSAAITLNGSTVQSGAGTYTFGLDSPTTITMAIKGALIVYCTAAITTD